MAYVFGRRRRARPKVDSRPKTRQVSDKPAEPPVAEMYVMGKKATAPEWRVAQALYRRKRLFEFQKPILGGRKPGGQILDFYIFTTPLPTPLNVQGEYWHRLAKSYADILKSNQTNELFGDAANPLVLVRELELGSVDEAYNTLDKKLGGW